MAENLKLKFLVSLSILVTVGVIIGRNNSEIPSDSVNKILNTSVQKDVEKSAVFSEEKLPTQIPAVPPGTQDLKKDTFPSEEANARETELEFLQMNIPASLSSIYNVRYQEVYSIYQKSSFYLSEIAADRLETNKEKLAKAFRGLILYFNEGNVMDQMDSALVIIHQEHPGLFDEDRKSVV